MIPRQWLLTVLLLSARLAAMLMVTPIFSALSVSGMVRVILVFALAVALSFGLPPLTPAPDPDLATLMSAIVAEVLIGATLGLGILMAFAAFSVAGRLLDVQIGFGIAQVFDPVSRRQVPVLSAAFEQLAIVVFFLVNGHHVLLRGLAFSLERFPPGQFSWLNLHLLPLLRQGSGMFALGFALVAPIVFSLFLLEFALGVITRNLPQMQVFVIAIPLKIIVGMALLGLWMGSAQVLMARVYASIFQSWEAVFR